MKMPFRLTALSLVAACSAFPQTGLPPATPQQVSPQAVYDQAVRPMEIVRKSMGNWSESELRALAVAMKTAGESCAARSAASYMDDDLIAFARLCSLGQNWPVMGDAAKRYIESDSPAKPQLAVAFGFKLEAALHAHDNAQIIATGKALLAAVPYDNTADLAINEALDYLQLAYTTDALEIAAARQPILLAALQTEKPLLPRSRLYADGVATAALLQYIGGVAAAGETIAALDPALGTALSADDAAPVANTRRRYALLGKPLPKLELQLSLLNLKETPHLNPDFGAATALILFPEWCAQCLRLGPDLWESMNLLGQREIRLYALLAEPPPDRAALLAASTTNIPATGVPTAILPPPHRTPTEMMLRTPTFIVPPETLALFAAEDFPFLIVADHKGVVRFAAPAPDTVVAANDMAERVTEHVAEQWPPSRPVNGGTGSVPPRKPPADR